MKQHLSEPLQKHLIKLVNDEANIEWSQKPPPPLPSFKETRVIRNSVGMWNLTKEIIIGSLVQLKP